LQLLDASPLTLTLSRGERGLRFRLNDGNRVFILSSLAHAGFSDNLLGIIGGGMKLTADFFARSLTLVLSVPSALFAVDIYWTDDVAGRIQRGNSSGGPIVTLMSTANGLSEPRGLALDVAGGKMYFADNGLNIIGRANLDGSGAETLVSSGLSFPADVELDLVNRKVYWTDRDNGYIRRANLDGSLVENVRTGIPDAYFMELDVAGGKVYWSNGDAPSIFRANLDGSGVVETLVSGLDHVRDVGLDLLDDRIYWGDRDTHKIQRRLISGGAVEDLFDASDGLDRPHGLALDLGERMMYWADTNTRSIMRGAMDGSGLAQTLYQAGISEPWDLEIVVPEPSVCFFAVAAGLMGLRRRRV